MTPQKPVCTLLLVMTLSACSNPRKELNKEALRVKDRMEEAGKSTLRTHEISWSPASDATIEMQCPEKRRVTFAPPDTHEEVIIGNTLYSRDLSSYDKRWSTRDILAERKTYHSYLECRDIGGYFGAFLTTDPYAQYDVADLGASTSRGVPCHKWKLSPPSHDVPGDKKEGLQICIGAEHEILYFEMERNGIMELYDFGAPITVEPPPPDEVKPK